MFWPILGLFSFTGVIGSVGTTRHAHATQTACTVTCVFLHLFFSVFVFLCV